MKFFKPIFDTIIRPFSREPNLPKATPASPFQVQSRMWFKLGPIPSVIEAKKEAGWRRVIGEWGDDLARGAKRKYEAEKLKELQKSFAIMQKDSSQGRKVRQCMLCSAVISLCNGHAISRDVMRAMKKEIQWADVRELCPQCDAKGMWNPFTFQDPRDHQVLFEQRNVIQ